MKKRLYPAGGFSKLSIKAVERGQSMVEIAFILPIFLVFIFAIIEFGRAWAVKQAITAAAQDGARILILPYGAGLTYTSEDAVRDAARAAVEASMNSSGTPVTASTKINPVRIKPGNDGIFNTPDDEIELYDTVLSPPVTRGDRVGIQIRYRFETPAPILLRMFDTGGGTTSQSVINMGVTCYMSHE